jgi:hypothetical protein
MTVTQRLMKPGSFRVQLKPGAPYSITSQVDVLDHIVITPVRLSTVRQFADADFLAAAVYTGVIIDRPGRTSIDGCDPSWWLGTTTGRGVITSPTAVASSSTISLSAWLALVLPFNGITSGTVTNTSTTSRAGLYQWVTRREALDAICQAAGAEWVMQPDFTVDAAVSSTLFATADPAAVVTRKRGGPEGSRYGLEAALLSQGRNATNIATGATAVSAIASSTATQSIGFVTPANGTPDLAMLVDARSEDTNLSTLATAVLASAGSLKTSLNVSARSHNIPLRVKPGDGLYVYDPEAGIVDLANQIAYRGEIITPMKLRVQAMTWPIEAGMGVYLRQSGSTPTYVDLTDWVEWEEADTYFEVGSSDPWLDEASPGTARLGANPDVSAGQAGPGGVVGYAEVTANQTLITTLTDLTSLTVTFTALANRRYRITGKALFLSSVASDVVNFWIADGSSVNQNVTGWSSPSTSFGVGALVQAIESPSAGSVTYKLRAERASGTGNVTMAAAATYPAFILVEDIGPA